MLPHRYSLKETIAPTIEPLDLLDVKTYLRVDHNSDDNLINSLILSARQACEKATGLSLINRSYNLYIDEWTSNSLFLPRPPLVSISAINIYAEDGSSSLYAAINYFVDNNGFSPRIVLNSGAVTPLASRKANGIEIQYIAGYGILTSDIPELLKQGMMQLITYIYEHRGDSIDKALDLSGANIVFKSYRKVSLL